MSDRVAPSDAFHLLDAWRLVMDYRYLISIVSAVAMVLSLGIAFTLKPLYRAEVVLSPVSANASGLSGQIGGLASLAGLNLGEAGGESKERMAILKSRVLIAKFIEHEKLLPLLFPEGDARRTSWFGVRKFQRQILGIKEDLRSGLITVTIEWPDPVRAASLANGFVAMANETIRLHDAENAERNIAFLTRKLQETSILAVQRDLYDLIEADTKTLMLASTRDDYAFAIVDPAVVPEQKAKPARALIVGLGGLFGMAIGVVAAVLRRTVARGS